MELHRDKMGLLSSSQLPGPSDLLNCVLIDFIAYQLYALRVLHGKASGSLCPGGCLYYSFNLCFHCRIDKIILMWLFTLVEAKPFALFPILANRNLGTQKQVFTSMTLWAFL